MKQPAENFAQLCRASFRFDDWLDLISDDQIYAAGRNTNFPLHAAHYWTHIASRKCVDSVGKAESFERDFQDFLCHIDIEPLHQDNANLSATEMGSSGNQHEYRYIERMHARSISKKRERI